MRFKSGPILAASWVEGSASHEAKNSEHLRLLIHVVVPSCHPSGADTERSHQCELERLRRWTRFHVILPAAADQQKQCRPADTSLVFSCAGNERQIQL